MKRHIFIMMVYCTLLYCGIGCNTAGEDVAAESAGDSEIRVYEVFGMDCPVCHGGIEKLVKKLPAVEQAKGNWVKKQLTVTVRPKIELKDEDIYDAIRRANFTPGKRIK